MDYFLTKNHDSVMFVGDFMKRKKRNFIVLSLLFCCLVLLGTASVVSVQAATHVTKKTVYIGTPYTLKINGKTQKGKWTSSNKDVAVVSSYGKITAKNRGKTTITAQIGKKKYQCVVTVKQPVTRILNLLNSYWIELGAPKYKLKVVPMPMDADNQKLIWKSSNPSIVKVNQDGEVTVLRQGQAHITVTAADRKKVSKTCRITVYKYSPPQIKPSKYDYKMYVLDGQGKDEWYPYVYRPIYIKTNNPDGNSLSWWMSHQACCGKGPAYKLLDIKYKKIYDEGSILKVDGGYVIYTDVSPMAVNNKGTFVLRENGKNVAYFDFKIKNIGEEQERILKGIIKKVTNNAMTPFEKMEAVTKYFENYPARYYPNNGTYLYLLAQVPTDIWWHAYRFDSYVTPAVLCRAAKLIGGFDKIENGYFKYTGIDWALKHYYAEVTIGDETRSYSFCPAVETGLIDPKNVKKINLKNLSNFTRIY